MADKDFVVKNGLVVNSSALVVNGSNVGINTTTPDAAFTVAAAANLQGNVSFSGSELSITANATFFGNVHTKNSVYIDEKLYVGNTATMVQDLPTIIQAVDNFNGFVMVSSQNLSKEDDACADLLIYADDTNGLSNFNDIGINNSRFDGRIHRIIVNATANSWSLGETVFQKNGAGANIAVGQIRDITVINATAVSLKIRVSEDDGIPTYLGMSDFANTTGSNLALSAATSGSNASILHAVPFFSPEANTLSRRNYAFTVGRRGDGYLYNANSALTIGTTGGGIRSTTLAISTSFSSGANVLTLSSGNTSLVKPDMDVTGTGVPANTYVTSVINSTAFRLSKTTTGTGSGSVTLRDEFYDLTEANNPIIFHVGGMMAKDEIARFSGTGNFTIGPNTTSRNAKLTVNGTANLVGQVNVGANVNVVGNINATANVNASRGIFTGNVVVGATLVNATTFAVGNATVNANFIEIDGNTTVSTAVLRSSNLTIGNGTVTDSGLVRVQNSASSANLTSNGLNAGISTIGQSTISVGANVVVNASAVSVGNTTVNVVMAQNTTTALSVTGNASVSANLTTGNLIVTSAVRGQANFAGNVAVTGNVNVTGNVYAPHGVFTTTVNVGQVLLTTTEIDVGANVSANFSSFSITGNSTVSTSVLQSGNLVIGNGSVTDTALVRVQNSTAIANMTPGLFSTGISTVNTTAMSVGANVIVNASAVSVGNSTVKVLASQNTTAALQVTGNATVSANLTTANLIVTSAIRGQANFAGNVAVTGNTSVTGNVYAPTGVFTTSVNVGSVSLSTTQTSVGGNVAVDLTGLKISGNTLIPSMNISGGNITSGNSTVANTPTVRVVNSTASANLTPTGIESGSIVVNAAGQTINVGANVWINSTVLAMGNTTANVVIEPGAAQWVLSVKGDARVNGSLLVKGDAIVNGSLTFSNTVAVNGDFIPVLNDSFTLGNTDRQWGAAYVVEINVPDGGRTTVGNSTVNSVVFPHSVRVSNSVGRFANVGLDAVSVGNLSSNGQLSQNDLRIGISTANAVLNASALVIGNASVNSTVNSSSFTGNVTATTVNTASLFVTGTANALTVNATTVIASAVRATTVNATSANVTTINSTSVNTTTANAINFYAVTNVVVGSAGGNVYANSSAFVGNVVSTSVRATTVNATSVNSTSMNAATVNATTLNAPTVNATTVNAATFQVGAAFKANTTDVVTPNLTVAGNLIVTGTTTTLNTAVLDVTDLNITVAKGTATAASADGAGMTVDGAGVTWNYSFASNGWLSNANVSIGNSTVNVAANSSAFVGNVVATRVTGNLVGNVTATAITGNLTGNVAATTITGNLTGNSFGVHTGNVVATTLSGNLTGNVAAVTITGNLTGNVAATTITGNLIGNVAATTLTGNLIGNVAAISITGNISGNVFATTISGNLTGNVAATTVSATANVTVGANVLVNTQSISITNSTAVYLQTATSTTLGNSSVVSAPQIVVQNTSGSTVINSNFISTRSISGNLTGNVVGNVSATTLSGNLTGNVAAVTITGNLTGNVIATTISGNLTGNVAATTISGNLTGNVSATTISGNLTGNVAATMVSATANVTVGANVLINTSALFIGNTVVNATVNSTFFTGTANNVSFVGSTAAAAVVNSATLASNLANYQTTAGLSANVATLTSNNTSFVGTTSAANVVSNTQLSSNLANYQTIAGLSANVAKLTANNTSFVGTTAAAAVVNSATLASNLANYQTTAGLSANVAKLTSNNSLNLGGTAASAYDKFPSGTRLLFQQAAAPTGWVRDDTTSLTNRSLRIVNGAGYVGTGGSVDFTTAFATQTVTGTIVANTVSISGTTQGFALANTHMPAHQHFTLRSGTVLSGSASVSNTEYVFSARDASGNYSYAMDGSTSVANVGLTSSTGGGSSHSHTLSLSDVGSHGHTFSGGNINLNVKYVDAIVATKS